MPRKYAMQTHTIDQCTKEAQVEDLFSGSVYLFSFFWFEKCQKKTPSLLTYFAKPPRGGHTLYCKSKQYEPQWWKQT